MFAIRRSKGLFLVCLLCGLSIQTVLAQTFVVKTDFMELRSGPGEAFPVFFVIEEGQKSRLIKRQGQWIEVGLPDGRSGWVDLDSYYFAVGAIAPPPVSVKRGRRIVNAGVGLFNGNGETGIGLGYWVKPRIEARLDWKRIVDNVSSNDAYQIVFVTPLLLRSFAPGVFVGMGFLNSNPESTLAGDQASFNRYVLFGGNLKYRFGSGVSVALSSMGNSIFLDGGQRMFWNHRLEVGSVF